MFQTFKKERVKSSAQRVDDESCVLMETPLIKRNYLLMTMNHRSYAKPFFTTTHSNQRRPYQCGNSYTYHEPRSFRMNKTSIFDAKKS